MAILQSAPGSTIDRITGWLGDEAEAMLGYTCKGITRDRLMLPGPDHVDQAFAASDRKPQVLVNLQRLYGHGRLDGTGYLSILPVDQGPEHSAAPSFAPNPAYFEPENPIRLPLTPRCNPLPSTL